MIEIRNASSDEMTLDDGFNPGLLGGVGSIVGGVIIGGYSVAISYPSFEPTSISATVIFIVIGICFVLSASWLKLVIDKVAGKLSLYRKKVIGTNSK